METPEEDFQTLARLVNDAITHVDVPEESIPIIIVYASGDLGNELKLLDRISQPPGTLYFMIDSRYAPQHVDQSMYHNIELFHHTRYVRMALRKQPELFPVSIFSINSQTVFPIQNIRNQAYALEEWASRSGFFSDCAQRNPTVRFIEHFQDQVSHRSSFEDELAITYAHKIIKKHMLQDYRFSTWELMLRALDNSEKNDFAPSTIALVNSFNTIIARGGQPLIDELKAAADTAKGDSNAATMFRVLVRKAAPIVRSEYGKKGDAIELLSNFASTTQIKTYI